MQSYVMLQFTVHHGKEACYLDTVSTNISQTGFILFLKEEQYTQ